MPFVLGDEGINYEEVPPLEMEGKEYAGVKISYEEGIGDSPKDEYIVYFDPETGVMSWLAYTVTYGKQEKSDSWSYIKYSKWSPVNGSTLPKGPTWYNVEEGKPTLPKREMLFENVTIAPDQLDAATFAKPEGAVVSE